MSRENVIQSMRRHTGEERIRRDNDRKETEIEIQRLIPEAIPKAKVMELRATASGNPLPYDEARLVAAAESLALLHQEADIFYSLPGMQTFYRAFRTMELMGSLRRRGKGLFVASGMTLPEVAAFYIKPPHGVWITEAYKPNAAKELQEKISQDRLGNFIEPVEFPFESAYSFDPREGLKPLIDQMRVVVHPLQVTHQEVGIRTFLENHDPNEETFDFIVINRADPRVFREYPQDGTKDKRPAIRKLRKFLKPGGQFCVTVGMGNNGVERRQRLEFIKAGCDGELGRDFKITFQTNHHDKIGQLLFASQNDIPEMLTATPIEKAVEVQRGKTESRRIN